MGTARRLTNKLIQLIPSGLVLISLVSPAPSYGSSALFDMDDIVSAVHSPRRQSKIVARAESEDATSDASTCLTCHPGKSERVRKSRKSRKASPAEPVEAEETTVDTSNLDEKLGLAAMHNATKPRRVAKFINKRRPYRSGNVSKAMCAQATKQTLMDAGICHTYPDGNAYALEGLKSLMKSCDGHVQILRTKDPRKAPKNSIIIYSGYAGKRPHRFGHVENKVVVTAAMKRKYGRDSVVRGSKVGDALYCSDMCRIKPTQTPNNPVAAIYQLI